MLKWMKAKHSDTLCCKPSVIEGENHKFKTGIGYIEAVSQNQERNKDGREREGERKGLSLCEVSCICFTMQQCTSDM